MTAIIVALVAVAIALAIQGLMLIHRARCLKAQEQAFRFHAIRDELQLLAFQGEVDPKSELYQFLLWTANLAIKNAGVMKVRDLLSIARAITEEIPDRFAKMVESQPESLQRVAAETFTALTHMLVANDPLVRWGVNCFLSARRAHQFIQPVVRSIVRGVDALARQMDPSRAEAVRYARDYSDLAGKIAA